MQGAQPPRCQRVNWQAQLALCYLPNSRGTLLRATLQAARDPEISVPPLKVPLLYGLACSIHMLMPAAYWYAARWQGQADHFEQAVLHAVNSGGNNMARAALTGEQEQAGRVPVPADCAWVRWREAGRHRPKEAGPRLPPHRMQARWWVPWWGPAPSRSASWTVSPMARSCARWLSGWRRMHSPTRPERPACLPACTPCEKLRLTKSLQQA